MSFGKGWINLFPYNLQKLSGVDKTGRNYQTVTQGLTQVSGPFRLYQTERVCRRQFQIRWKWQKVLQTDRKHCGKRRNCSLRAISPFPTVFSKELYCRHVNTKACFEKVKEDRQHVGRSIIKHRWHGSAHNIFSLIYIQSDGKNVTSSLSNTFM